MQFVHVGVLVRGIDYGVRVTSYMTLLDDEGNRSWLMSQLTK